MDPCEEAARIIAARVLGITPDAGATEVRRAYRRMMRKHHPDMTGVDSDEVIYRVQAAYDLLVRPNGNHTPIMERNDITTDKSAERAHGFYRAHVQTDHLPLLDVWA